MLIAEIIVYAVFAYAAIGVPFAVWFVISGASKMDIAARGSGVGFRIIIFSGAAALWIVLAAQIARQRTAVPQRNAHRSAAEG